MHIGMHGVTDLESGGFAGIRIRSMTLLPVLSIFFLINHIGGTHNINVSNSEKILNKVLTKIFFFIMIYHNSCATMTILVLCKTMQTGNLQLAIL